MGKLISMGCPEASEEESRGEIDFAKKAEEYFDSDCVIYWHHQINGREFDFCVLIPDKGILIIEVKGWREKTVLRVEDNKGIVIQGKESESTEYPLSQARQYRKDIWDMLKRRLGKRPLVVPMVSFPLLSKAFYKEKKLDRATEESFTFLKEDMESKSAFYSKLSEALKRLGTRGRDPFDSRTMLEVRSLFEPSIELEQKEKGLLNGRHDYSRFYCIAGDESQLDELIGEMTRQYLRGCKLYCVFSTKEQLRKAVQALDEALTGQGLVRDREDIRFSFEETAVHRPELSEDAMSFMAFHVAFSVADAPEEFSTFCVVNGGCGEAQKDLLRTLGEHSQFNAEQYFVEHAPADKNIVIRAGAGTGKTYTMISRISYICYSQDVPLQKMAERIVMITFTNEAAEQMSEKLKVYFRNCYLVTSRAEYMHMVSQVDHMQISTIHSYAKRLIAQMGTAFGYGIDLSITSGEFQRRRKIINAVDQYVQKKAEEERRQEPKKGHPDYITRLGIPMYMLHKIILDFIGKLHNKSVDIAAIQGKNFGDLKSGGQYKELHALLAHIIPLVEREYAEELLDSNQIHLSSMMSLLNCFMKASGSAERIRELKKEEQAQQFMFVDEFQDTDNTQIETLLALAGLLDYKLFLVGDIKQCIYRFRGAEEAAFDQLHMEENPDAWQEYSLRRNYRSDAALLDLFDRSFSAWSAQRNGLLVYQAERDRLIGTRDYNGYLSQYKGYKRGFYRRCVVRSSGERIPKLIKEIQWIQKRIRYEEEMGLTLSPKEKSIAILVRENWQAEVVRKECGREGISVQTNTGGDLYMSQPALDMMTLVNALVHFDEGTYLYNLAISNFFKFTRSRAYMFKLRAQLRQSGHGAQAGEPSQVNELIDVMNDKLRKIDGGNKSWESIVANSLRTEPVLQVLRNLYNTLEPWKNYSGDPWKQHAYQMNVDLLFEQMINMCSVDRLTINTLQEHLFQCIVSKVSVDSRSPLPDEKELPIQCITVHKSKGLEYGHVILPFCSTPVDLIKRAQLHVSIQKSGDELHIGYKVTPDKGDPSSPSFQNNFYDENAEKDEKSREEARILYVAMTRAIRTFSWIEEKEKKNLSWQSLIEKEV